MPPSGVRQMSSSRVKGKKERLGTTWLPIISETPRADESPRPHACVFFLLHANFCTTEQDHSINDDRTSHSHVSALNLLFRVTCRHFKVPLISWALRELSNAGSAALLPAQHSWIVQGVRIQRWPWVKSQLLCFDSGCSYWWRDK